MHRLRRRMRLPPPVTNAANRVLDRVVRPELRLAGRTRSSFRVFAYAGVALATPLALGLARIRGLSVALTAGLLVLAIATGLGLAAATKAVTGEERLTHYHHILAVLGAAAAVLAAIGRPVMPYLDLLVLAAGAFFACGRVGCLMAGCCHGRPHAWGVRYRAEHLAAGFPSCYAGARLVPVQAVEAVWLATIVAVGAGMAVAGSPAGAALAWYVIGYGWGRFLFEFVRGDAERPYLAGFSEAQWTSALLVLAVAAAGAGGLVPARPWHAVAAAALVLAMAGVAGARRARRAPTHRLLHARHVREVAEAVARSRPSGADVRVERTSAGVRLSTGSVTRTGDRVVHYTLSADPPGLAPEAARALTTLIRRLRPASAPWATVIGRGGAVHLVAGGRDRRPSSRSGPEIEPDRAPRDAARMGSRSRRRDPDDRIEG